MNKITPSNSKYIITNDFDSEKYVECGVITLLDFDNYDDATDSHTIIITNEKAYDKITSILHSTDERIYYSISQDFGDCLIEKTELLDSNVFSTSKDFFKAFPNVKISYERKQNSKRLIPSLICVTPKTEKAIKRLEDNSCRPD